MAKPLGDKMPPERRKAFQNLKIDPNDRVILSMDGGGMRGMLTIQLLKKLEEAAGIPCYDLFDMVAGTSTGGIIAGLILKGFTAVEIEEKYEMLIKQVFHPRPVGNRFVNPPQFSKKVYRQLLKNIIGNKLTLEEAGKIKDLDLLLTSRDMAAAEETFFTCFKQKKDGSYYGTYKDVLLRAVMESTMSAPTYFYPLERFVDGGVTTYNNPSLAAFIEAVSYSTRYKDRDFREYYTKQMTVISLGTGATQKFIKPTKTLNPKGIDLKFWLDWLISETGEDSSTVQTNTFRSFMMLESVVYRRYQISLDPTALKKLPNIDALDPKKYKSKWLWDLDEKILGNIDMADINRMDLMKVIGQQMAAYIMESGNCFTKDLIDEKRNDILVSSFGDEERIKKQMSDPDWLDNYQA
ncbi:MAG TPA: patatin-like phospholipase family protein [Chitinophagaceae bacterium]|nr:patatin-like phospholipase family protein [Chitinophagaceae bacterium]